LLADLIALLGQQHHLPHELLDEVPLAVRDLIVAGRHGGVRPRHRDLLLRCDELSAGKREHGCLRTALVPQPAPARPPARPAAGPTTAPPPPTSGRHRRPMDRGSSPPP